jgi:rhodanese-related sulfurtransferase
MSASWLAQMGWEVYVVDGGFDGPLALGPWKPQVPPTPEAQLITAQELSLRDAWGGVAVIDLAPSPVHARRHVPGAWFAIRSRLAQALSEVRPHSFEAIVLTSPDGLLARLAAPEVESLLGRTPLVLDGGTAGWAAADLPLETGITRAASEPDDVYRRPYEGTDTPASAMQAYLDWEFGLVAQLERDATHGFYVI